ncbi:MULTISPECIES: hypothetical protein [unclassified Mycobacterium]|nr:MULTISPECIES: hypothetical protein [unclassified Mycobacterium]
MGAAGAQARVAAPLGVLAEAPVGAVRRELATYRRARPNDPYRRDHNQG